MFVKQFGMPQDIKHYSNILTKTHPLIPSCILKYLTDQEAITVYSISVHVQVPTLGMKQDVASLIADSLSREAKNGVDHSDVMTLFILR